MKDAASILEFLAWGRHKDPEYHSTVSPEATLAVGTASGDVWDKGSHALESATDPFGDCSQLSVIQLLLPSPQQVWQLVQYHEECLLWYHGSFFAPSFRDQLEAFYADYGGMIDRPGVNLQWVALLFSIMTGSLVCCPSATLQSWGFRDPERRTLSKRWFGVVLTCLNRADYTANLSILSCQAIATSTISAHLLGFSSSQSIQLAAAVRIAQSLGLHRLGSETTRNTIDREIGRRVWCQLCSQDWFGIPFSESYLINPLYSTSEPPLNCHDQDLLPLPVDTPTITSYCRFLCEVASIIPQLQDDLMVRNTPYTRYEQVLAWDARLRTLVTTERPMFLSHVPIDPQWPCWIPWARRALAISSGHKIIMIHRSFLSDSFTNPAFAFTRRTCLAASKTIIKEYKCVAEEDGPTLWIHQAFSVAASVILLLDVLHRDPNDRESAQHKQLAESVVEILHYHQNSMIAVRGIKLLGALLAEVSKVGSTSGAPNQGRKRRRHDDTFVSSNADSPRNIRSGYKFDLTGFVKTFSVGTASGQSAGSSRSAGQQQSPAGVQVENPQESDNVGEPGREDAGHIIEPPIGYSFNTAGLDGANSFENLLYLVNHDCFSMP
ncbi:hypothetical protein GCG54_00015144 [Colletotrichum gloeosporioides]|uniref:Transcription factor domain-containing protein n=1 Tax=Colletotrichum gloeosporioides TaxID=474922 RepID=A0A8H4CDR3_COLGL|nr:uncharacterized protein GCG54_00015144 [Colletotrichum gloeosporioides]KAF3801922.1 hypothetical protein GCG54_00015144 [Colletotrichum gloeosporioides]